MKNTLAAIVGRAKNSSQFTKSVLILTSGTALAQVLAFLFSIITSRIYIPQDYGKIAVFNSAVAMIAVISTGQYATAIMIDKNQKDAKNTWLLSLLISSGVSLLVLIYLIIYRIFFPAVEVFSNLIIFLMPVQVLVGGLCSSCSVWCNRSGIYSTISKLSVANAIIAFGFNFVFGVLKLGATGLLLAGTISQTISMVIMIYCIRKRTDFSSLPVNSSSVLKQAKLHIDFPKYNILASLLGTASTQLPVILFAKFYNNYVVGGYSRAIQVINIPMTLVGSAVGNVFFKEAASIEHAGDKKKLEELVYSTYKRLLLIGIIPMSVLFGYGDILFRFVFGSSWYAAGRYSQILAPWFALVFVTSPLSSLLYVLGKQKQNTVIQFILLASRILAVVCGGAFRLEFTNSLMVFSLTGTVIWIFINSYILSLVKISFVKSTFHAIVKIAAVFFILIASRCLMNLLLHSSF
jgi:lipopolysaccharide exporter